MKTDSNNGRRIVLIDGCRIPFLRSGTGYHDLTSYDLGRLALKALLDRTQLPAGKIDQVIMGTVISNMATSNVARESALGAGIPHAVPASTVTLACISANLAVTTGVNLIRTGQADIIVAGGTESCSDIPIRYRKRFRNKLVESRKYRHFYDYWKLFKGLRFSDVLPEIPSVTEFSTGRTMGLDCDRLAARLGVTRKEQDAFAVRSHLAAARATREGLLAEEIEPVRVPPHFSPIDQDNGIRGDTSLDKMQTLSPAFVKPFGTVTAGNASFLSDGAAAVLIMAEDAAVAMGFKPKAFIHAFAYSAQDPGEELLLGPAYAIPKVLDRAGMKLTDMDVFEFHEAFAGQVLANLKCLDSKQFAREKLGKESKIGEVPMEKFNTLGGSLSLGHPFGATGARLITTAANRLLREDGQFALIASCAAGAHGNAMILERC
ncbi:MAG: acetyl-CoA C-acyltransferase [Desulfobacterales bacterium]|nr:acetyl-CoA C-acyltransferase [Desulfobacterales bacterium]